MSHFAIRFGLLPFLSAFMLIFAIGFSLPAHAHKVLASAYADGDAIEGEIGFSNGDMAPDALVEIFDDEGNQLGTAKTDADGIFRFKPTKAVAHIFKANLGQGHIADFRLEVDELPDGLTQSEAPKASADKPKITPTASDSSTSASTMMDQSVLEEAFKRGVQAEIAKLKPELAAALRKEVKPLRKEITLYREKNDFQTILGGIGYILGLFGIGFYIAARRERAKMTQALAGDKA